MSGARAVARCDALGAPPYSDAPDMLFRAYLTPAFAATQAAIAGWMVETGMSVRLDAAANLIGRYEGAQAGAPALLIGSHIDSVRDAGRYDGPLGVMLGIECVAALHAAGRRLSFAIEVIAFGDEEGSRFPSPMLTSRAVAGVPGDWDAVDAAGVSVGEALADYLARHPQIRHPGESWGLDEARAALSNRETPAFAGVTGKAGVTGAVAYLEAHIEQGPALEAEGLPVGVVTGIAAQVRYALVIEGMAGHAGTTSMALRRDALAAAAEIVLAAERIGGAGPDDLVATVGRLSVSPGAVNVIAGHVECSLDVRALDPAVRDAAADAIVAEARRIGAVRGVGVAAEKVHDLAASPCDPKLIALLCEAVVAEGLPDRRLASGAGHDAMVMAALCPTAMLFIRCAGGISHNPAERVDAADVEVALRVMLGFIDLLGASFDA